MINAIFAVDQFGGMGFGGSLPWPRNTADLSKFKKLTTGNVVVMGSNSWNDPTIPKPLVGRTVYVATHRHVDHAVGISGDLKEEILKLEHQHPDKIIWIAGGPNVIEQCTGIIDRAYVTHIHGAHRSDVKIDMKRFLSGWRAVYATGDSLTGCTFVEYCPMFKRSAQ